MACCDMSECKVRVSKLIGLCKHCNKYYCSFHRIPETHLCEKLDEYKESKRLLLIKKLMDERTPKRAFF